MYIPKDEIKKIERKTRKLLSKIKKLKKANDEPENLINTYIQLEETILSIKNIYLTYILNLDEKLNEKTNNITGENHINKKEYYFYTDELFQNNIIQEIMLRNIQRRQIYAQLEEIGCYELDELQGYCNQKENYYKKLIAS